MCGAVLFFLALPLVAILLGTSDLAAQTPPTQPDPTAVVKSPTIDNTSPEPEAPIHHAAAIGAPPAAPSPISEMNYWSLYIIIFFTFSQLLLLGFVLTLAYKLEKLMRNVQEMSRDAGKFLRMGVNYFKSQK